MRTYQISKSIVNGLSLRKSVLLLFALTFPLYAMASDFSVLNVGVGALLISVILVFLCIKGAGAARTKPRNEVSTYSFGSIGLSLIGVSMVSDELTHFGSMD